MKRKLIYYPEQILAAARYLHKHNKYSNIPALRDVQHWYDSILDTAANAALNNKIYISTVGYLITVDSDNDTDYYVDVFVEPNLPVEDSVFEYKTIGE